MLQILFLSMALLPYPKAQAADPVGVIEVPHGVKLPAKDLAGPTVVGYQGEEPTSDLLVWAKSGTAAKPKYEVRDGKGKPYLFDPAKATYTPIEKHLIDSTTLILSKDTWDSKVRANPGDSAFKIVTLPVPPALQFEEALDFGPLKCREAGSAQDKSGATWKKESCEAGKPVDIFEAPEGARLKLPGRSGAMEEYRASESELPMALLAYNVPVSFHEKLRQAVLVYEQKAGWARVRFKSIPPYNGRSGWIRLSSTSGTIIPLSSVTKKDAIEQNEELQSLSKAATAREEFWVKARKVASVKDHSWVLLDIYQEDPCSFPTTPTILSTGWVRLMASPSALQFSITTCD